MSKPRSVTVLSSVSSYLKDYWLIGLIVLFLVTRLFNLTLLPIFTDEAIYIYWAKYIESTNSHWFISLTDGKPPLLIWTIAILIKIFPSSWYLLAGRLPSVFFGAMTLLAIYFLAQLLFKNKIISIIAATLYILSPFTLFYDRMALFDSLLQAMMTWIAYFAIKTAQSQKIKDAIIWGIFLGLAFFSKAPAILFLGFTPLALFLFPKENKFNIKRAAILGFIAIIIGEAINNLQRISRVYNEAARKNAQFQQPWSELLKDPFKLTSGNLHAFFSWIIGYYTLPIFIIGVLAFIILLVKHVKVAIYFFILWFGSIFILATVGREIFPRYVLFTTPYFLLTISYAIGYLYQQKKVIKVTAFGILVVVIVFFTQFDFLLVTYPPSAPLPQTDYTQYISRHPSGYGIDRITQFIKNESAHDKVTLVVQGTFGLYPYVFNLEFWDNKNVTIIPLWPLTLDFPDIKKARSNSKVYVVLKEYDEFPSEFADRLEPIITAQKPGGYNPIFLAKFKD